MTKISSTLKQHSRVAVAVVALLATLAILFSQMLVKVTNASDEVMLPDTAATVNENGEAYIDILGANLLYEDYLHIIYGVQLNLGEGDFSEVKMLFWNEAQQSYERGTTKVERAREEGDPETIKIGGVSYENCVRFLSDGIAAKAIGDTVYARAYVTDGEGNIYYSNVAKYSVLEYVYSRYRDADNGNQVSETRMHLYNTILTYGARAQIILDYKTDRLVTSHGARIEVKGGHISDGFTAGVYLAGDSVTMIADMSATNGDFLRWEYNGETVSTEKVLTVKIDNETKSGAYTAVYSGATSVKVVGGTLHTGVNAGVFASGNTYTVTASNPNNFRYWVDENGEKVSEEVSFTLTAGEGVMSKVYTAVGYGAASVTVSGGTVSGIDADGKVDYLGSFTITADDRSGEKRAFKAWLDKDGNAVSASAVFTLTVDKTLADSALSYTATYYEPVTVTVEGGTVNGAASATLAYGESYTVEYVPGAGEVFSGWKVDGAASDLAESFTAVAGERSVAYEAISVAAGKADFETLDIAEITKKVNYTSGGYQFMLQESSSNFAAYIANDPTNAANRVLKMQDKNNDFGAGVEFGFIGNGAYSVVEFDIYVSEDVTGTPIQIQLGEAYMLQLTAVEDKAIRLYDVSKPTSSSVSGYLNTYFSTGEWHSIKLVINPDNGSSAPNSRAYVFVDGECVVKSLNVAPKAVDNKVIFYSLNSDVATVYYDNIAAYKGAISAEEEASFAPLSVIETPSTALKDRFENAEILLSADALAALKEMDENLFSEDIYLWVADLYDPESGAFYFSISGSTAYGYLADIETTSQASGVLNNLLGMGNLSNVLNAEQKANLLSWVQTLQSNRDGYNYHPHWGVNIGTSRQSRDYSYASASYTASGALAYRLFNDANYRLSDGASGTKGVVVSTEYDNDSTVTLSAWNNNLTERLGISAVAAASKVILASSGSGSSMPSYLQSEEAFANYLNSKWNSTCKLSGTHERHICTDSCRQVADANDSYMTMENGKLTFIRGYRCETGHVCSHELGHSYAYGHNFTSMSAQVKSAGLSRACVEYFYDIQENVQRSLIAQGKEPNGIWEETVTYSTISGLLKICGIPTAHGYEFRYAKEAIASAIEVALYSVKDFDDKGEAIVSIYNPYNAINGIMNNVEQYASSNQVKLDARALIRENAADLINNVAGKLSLFLTPDGGYSYSQSHSCTNSQGQPVAISGADEGDVNGTALAFGTRSALLSTLGVSVSAPFSGDNAYIEGGFDLDGDGDKDDSFDLDLDGVAEVFESNCTHLQRFKYLITTKQQIVKKDNAEEGRVETYDDAEIGDEVNGGSVVLEGNNKVIEAVDNSSGSGHTSTFDVQMVVGENNNTVLSFDMKAVSANSTTTHQIFAGANNTIRIDMVHSGGKFSFNNVITVGKSTNTKSLCDKNTGKALSVISNSWFNVNIVIDYDGFTEGGVTYYGIFTVTQNGESQTAYLHALNSSSVVDHLRLYTLQGAIATTRYDNISATSYVEAGVHDGEYLFDQQTQQIAGSDVLVQNPTTSSYDKVYLLNGREVKFDAYDYTGSTVIYNFNSVQLGLLLNEAKNGDRIELALVDDTGRLITGIYLDVSIFGNQTLVSFHAANGKVLEECIPRTYYADDGSAYTATKLAEMILDVNVAKWITVKLEYHYDMADPQLDVVVRYGDNTKNGYYTTTAASLTGVDVCTGGANPYAFDKLSIESTGKIYLDDLYIRNVYDACEEHIYINKEAKSFLKETDSFGHKIYYKSCQKCGLTNGETFTVHIYQRDTQDKYKIADASIYSPAIYVESCRLCGEKSDITYTVGIALEDPTKHNFTSIEDTIPNYVSCNTDGNKWAKVLSEEIDGVINYYLNVGKKATSGTNAFTLHYVKGANEGIASRYVYEFDFRWQGASNHVNEIIYVKVGNYVYTSGTVNKTEYKSSGTFSTNADASYVNYCNVTLFKGEWHSMKYIFEKTGAGKWSMSVFIDGTRVQSEYILDGTGVPYVNYETRWPRTVDGIDYSNDVSFDVDRLKAYTADSHTWIQQPDPAYLKTAATCYEPAVYYNSCAVCGVASDTDTFTVGTAADHVFVNRVGEGNLKTVATCTVEGEYYKVCRFCDLISDTEYFSVGSLGHVEQRVVVAEATKDTPMLVKYVCTRECGYESDVREEGDPLSWGFDKEGMPESVTVNHWKNNGATSTTGSYASVQTDADGNKYLELGKQTGSASHHLIFTPDIEDGVTKVIYEMDFRWQGSPDAATGAMYIKFRNKDYDKSDYMICHSWNNLSNGNLSLQDSKGTFVKGEWYTIRYEFTLAEGTSEVSCRILLNGTVVDQFTLGAMVKELDFETRGYYNMVVNIDNIYVDYE